MRDRFYGKTWFFWVMLVVSGGLGLLAVGFGTMFWAGAMKDANGEPRPAAGPPMVAVGSLLLATAALAVFNLVGRLAPVVRCYRDGVECNLIGATSLDGVPVPRAVRLLWTLLSTQGFRSRRVRLPWATFAGVRVGGFTMAYRLTFDGPATDARTGLPVPTVVFKQAMFRDGPQAIADAVNGLAADPAARGRLAAWPSAARIV